MDTFQGSFDIRVFKKNLISVILTGLEQVYPLLCEYTSDAIMLRPEGTTGWKKLEDLAIALQKLDEAARKELTDRLKNNGDCRFPFFEVRVKIWENSPGEFSNEGSVRLNENEYNISLGSLIVCRCLVEKGHHDSDQSGKAGCIHRAITFRQQYFGAEHHFDNSVIRIVRDEVLIRKIYNCFEKYY